MIRELSDDEFTKLAHALFDEDERMLSEGRVWEKLDNSDVAAYRNMAKAVVVALRELSGRER